MKRAGGGDVAAFCARKDDDNQMPAMIRILDGISQSVPNLTTLKDIFRDYEQNPANPKLKNRIKEQLLSGALDSILIVLNDLFGSPDNVEGGLLKADCIPVFRSILDALMDDLPLHTYIKMLFQIFMKSYYNDSRIRVAFGAAFLGSQLYILWATAINPIAGLAGEVGGYVMTVCNMLMNAATVPTSLESILSTFISQQQAMGYSTEIINGAADFITFLNSQIKNPSNIIFICALTNLYFMEKLYPAQNFEPLTELRRPEAVAAAGVPVPALAVPANAPQFGQQPHGQDPLFEQMIQPLIDGRDMVIGGVKQYLLTTVNRFRKISYVMPGKVGSPEQSLEAGCLNFMLSISNYIITHAETQAEHARMDPSIIKATIILKSIFDTESLLNETPTQVAGIIYTLAFSIRNRVIENLTRDARVNRDAAAKSLEVKCPVFRSRLTIEELNQHNLSLCVAGRLQWLLDNTSPSDDFNSLSVAVSLSQSEDDRDRAADDLLRNLFESGANIHFTDNEISTFRARGINLSLFTSVQKVFSIGIQSIVNCANKLGVIPFTLSIGTQLVDLLRPPAKPLSLINSALPIASVLTNPFFPQITEISDIILDGITKKMTPSDIHDEIMNKFGADTPEKQKKVLEFIEHLLLLCDVQTKFRFHEMKTASGFIVGSDRKPSLALVLNSDTTPFRDNFIRILTTLVKPEEVSASDSASGSASVSASGSASGSASASEPVVSGVFVGLQQEIQSMVCRKAATSSASKEEKAAAAQAAQAEQAIIDCGVELTRFIGPKLSNPDEQAVVVTDVNLVLQQMLGKLPPNVDVGDMVLEAAIFNQEDNERLNQEENERSGDGDGEQANMEVDQPEKAKGIDFTVLANPLENPPTVTTDRFLRDRHAQSAESDVDPLQNRRSGDHSPPPPPPSEDNGAGMIGGGKSRRKSRKNMKKTTRRNKKIVRKSSKNTKQRRSSLRRRSSRKSRK